VPAPHRLPTRRPAALAALVAICAALIVAATTASAAAVTIGSGTTPEATVFPSDAFTVADSAQVTGRRLALPTPAGCTADPALSICDDIRLINQLDGYDLRPRITIPFSGPIDVRSVTADSVYVQKPDGSRTKLVQLVFDPDRNVLAGQPQDVLVESTTYTIVIAAGLRDATGAAVDPCATGCAAGATTRRTTFTTGTATGARARPRRGACCCGVAALRPARCGVRPPR
jgi:hypothetical protein